MSQVIATIAQLCVYPIKSMAGISVDEAHVGLDGILGDRQYSFVRADQAARNSFPWMTARESSRMLLYKPYFVQLPTPEQPEPPVRVRTPEGAEREPSDPGLREELAGELGQPIFLPASSQPFEEETWTGCLLEIGDQVLTGVTQRDPRCMMVNLDPESGKQDPRVLRAVAQKHQGQAGVYANVVRPGVIRVGDAIRLVAKP
jgi:hypothetical protein